MALTEGVEPIFPIEGNAVLLEKARPIDTGWHRMVEATLAPEWESPEDDEAFRDLQPL